MTKGADMDLQLAGRTAIITGGSLGIGLASAKTLAKLGVRPALVARRKEPLDAAVKEIADEMDVASTDLVMPDQPQAPELPKTRTGLRPAVGVGSSAGVAANARSTVGKPAVQRRTVSAGETAGPERMAAPRRSMGPITPSRLGGVGAAEGAVQLQSAASAGVAV